MLYELTARAAAKAEHKILFKFHFDFPLNKNFIINSRKREKKKPIHKLQIGTENKLSS